MMSHGDIACRALALLALGLSGCAGDDPTPIRQGSGYGLVPRFSGRAAVPRPLVGAPLPQHPFMAAGGSNNMHGDSYVSDTHAASGPLGKDPVIVSTARGLLGGECASVTFDRQGRILTVCASVARMELLLLDPRTLRELAHYRLPRRPSTRTLSIRRITSDTSGGVYFYLDERDRAVLGTAARRLEVVAHDDSGFHLERVYDLAPAVPGGDAVTAVLPDWTGRYWFVTRQGLVGTVDPQNGRIATRELAGEEIENSFAVGPDGVFIVSDHAMYGFTADAASGAPEIGWREVYDRGTRRKVGQIDQGSGTTPTLLGEEWVAIADNAEPRLNVLVYRRRRDVAGTRLLCREPVFPPGASATENTFVGFGHSLIVENNAGYDIFPTMMFGRTGAGGVARVDLDDDGEGCHVVWQSGEVSQTAVPKLSLGNGLLYLYTKLPGAPWWTDAYYLTAVDFRTGETVYGVLTGTGLGYDNHWAAITIGPDGTAYVGTLRGLLAVRDGS